jgi:hypothetical protein
MKINELVTINDLNELEARLTKKLETLTSARRPKKWLRTKDVVEILGLSTSSVQNLRIKNILPYKKINGTLFYEYEAIESLLKSNSDSFKGNS